MSSRRRQTVGELTRDFGIAHAFDEYEGLIAIPTWTWWVIPAPAPAQARLVKAAIAGGKDVYCGGDEASPADRCALASGRDQFECPLEDADTFQLPSGV